MRVVLFDVDGTLLWTDGAGRRAIRHAMVDVLGSTGPIEGFRFDGRTDPEIVRRLAEGGGLDAGPGAVRRVLDRYVELLALELARPGHSTRVYPGVPELLEALERRADCVLGLLTGNIAPGARLKLASAGLDMARFRVGAFGSDSEERAALPAVAQRRARRLLGSEVVGSDLVIVGDTPADMTCGQGVGARSIGVATGSFSVTELLAAGAAAAFPDLSPTAAVLAAALGL